MTRSNQWLTFLVTAEADYNIKDYCNCLDNIWPTMYKELW